MTTNMSLSSSPATSPPTSPPNPNLASLPPLITSPQPRRSNLQRPVSHASKGRMSQYSSTSGPSRSRPPSYAFPFHPSSLSYTLVRDFAYQQFHPLYYGAPPEPSEPPSGMTTPASEHKRFSDPPTSWDSRSSWGPGPWGGDGLMKGENLQPIHLGDGPPWSEDEDLQSPVVVSSRHKKHKSTSSRLNSQGAERGRGRNSRRPSEQDPNVSSATSFEEEKGIYTGSNGERSERYFADGVGSEDGPSGEFVTYSASQTQHNQSMNHPGQRDSHFAGTMLPNRSYTDGRPSNYPDSDSSASSPGVGHDESRYSRDYQFTIASPDEEMHGKAVALFDFERENENELPLVEGQVIWVSYRHGQGWLVAEDPKTQESGLVPEEYVRLLRDIQGGLHSLTGQVDSAVSPGDVLQEIGTPTQAEQVNETSFEETYPGGRKPSVSNGGANGQAVVSTFSTSSKDLHPYPQHLLGTKEGMAPPQVVHYHGQRGGSQANTPTLASSGETLAATVAERSDGLVSPASPVTES